jgi:hypothetical protein
LPLLDSGDRDVIGIGANIPIPGSTADYDSNAVLTCQLRLAIS